MKFVHNNFTLSYSIGKLSRGVLDLSLGRGVPPGPWKPDPVCDKKLVKIMEN